jgi:hypothetical protein
MGLSTFPAASGGFKKYAQTFTSTGTWTAPTGVTSVDVICVGGGGGGGYASVGSTSAYQTVGGGGGGGQVARASVDVTPGTVYNVTVGTGGTGGIGNYSLTPSYEAQAGGYSSFNSVMKLDNGVLNGGLEAGEPSEVTFYEWESYNVTGSSVSSNPAYRTGSQAWSTLDYQSGNMPAISGITNTRYAYTGALYSTGSGSPSFGEVMTWVPVTAGTAYMASIYAANGGGTPTAFIRYTWYDKFRGTVLSTNLSSGTNLTSSSVWNRLSFGATAPTSATWLLIRYQFDISGSGVSGSVVRWKGAQVESGSTLTAYKHPLTSSTTSFTNGIGYTSGASGVLASGGGPGQSYVGSSGGSFLPPVFGGGAAYYYPGNTSTVHAIGGNGASALEGAKNPVFARHNSTSQVGAPSRALARTLVNVAVPQGGSAWQFTTSDNAYAYQASGSIATPEGYGAGGMGGITNSGQVIPGTPSVNAGQTSKGSFAGLHGQPNTGAGGGGGAHYQGAYGAYSGGNGGSGIVALAWMGA